MTMNDNDKPTISTPRRWIAKEEAIKRWPPKKGELYT